MEMSSVPTPLGQAPMPSSNTNSGNDYALESSTNNNTTTTTNTADNDLHLDLDEEATATESKITNLKFLNATSFALTAVMVTGIVLGKVREEGTFGDDYLWMKYQTLLTPAAPINYIWIPIFLLQGLFIYASTQHETLRTSPLVGYHAAVSGLSNQSVAVHYPAVCATTLMMVYSHDYGYVAWAFLSSLLCGFVLGNVLKIQMGILNEMEGGGSIGSSMSGDINDIDSDEIKSQALQYVSLRLPFEFYGGYTLALIALYFNMFLHTLDVLPTMVYLVAANVSLAALLGMGFLMLWKVPERKYYGAGVALIWYLLGVAVELHEPTQPIYNEFSDGAILTTQIVAGVATTILMTMLGVRVTKTMIKRNLFHCGDRFGNKSTSVNTEDEISTGYVHA